MKLATGNGELSNVFIHLKVCETSSFLCNEVVATTYFKLLWLRVFEKYGTKGSKMG